jgi:hypothetical protein
MEIVGDKESASKKEIRALLIPAEYEDGKAEFDHYCIVDDDEDALEDIFFKDNPDISHTAEQFYTRGAFRAPFLIYQGMNESPDAIEAYGEAVPSFLIYEAGKKDERTKEVLIAGSCIGEPSQYVWTDTDFDELNLNKEAYIWEIGFPTAYDSTFLSKFLDKDGKTQYRKSTADMAAIGAYIPKEKMYYWITDEYPGAVQNWRLVGGEYGAYFDYEDYRQLYFKLYLGVKEEAEVIDGTVTVKDGQTKIIDGAALIKDGACLKVEKGGTVFISGYCGNNGVLLLEGGTVIVQKGAVIAPMSPQKKTKSTGEITVNNGNLIIREGACVANFVSGINCSLVVRNNGQVINRGIIASYQDIWVEDNGLLHNQGAMYMGVKLKLGEGVETYTTLSGLSLKEYADQSVAMFEKKIQSSGRASYVCHIYNASTKLKGFFKNEGSYRRY